MRLSDKIKWLTMNAIMRDLDEEREDCIHVSDIVYSCVRRGYYSIIKRRTFENSGLDRYLRTLSEDEAITFWVGKKLHETVISPEEIEGLSCHELPVEVEFERKGKRYRVVGRVDELIKVDGEWVLCDKKTTRHQVNQVYSHHKEQVLIYSAMLKKQYGINVTRGAVIYINVTDKTIDVKEFPIPSKKREIFDTIVERVVAIQDAIDGGGLPPPSPGWLCKYCEHYQMCVEDGW